MLPLPFLTMSSYIFIWNKVGQFLLFYQVSSWLPLFVLIWVSLMLWWDYVYLLWVITPGSWLLLSPDTQYSVSFSSSLPSGSQSGLEFQWNSISIPSFIGKSGAKVLSKLPFLKWALPKLSLYSTLGVQ